MDAFAVSLSIGTAGEIRSLRGKIRLAAHFGIFQSGMTALGWLMGETVVNYIKGFDHWIAMALLGYVGVNLIRAGFNKDEKAFNQDPSTGRTLVLLSFATSIDAFVVGLSIIFLKIPILLSVIAIGLITFLLSTTGLFAGTRLGETFGKRMEILGNFEPGLPELFTRSGQPERTEDVSDDPLRKVDRRKCGNQDPLFHFQLVDECKGFSESKT